MRNDAAEPKNCQILHVFVKNWLSLYHLFQINHLRQDDLLM